MVTNIHSCWFISIKVEVTDKYLAQQADNGTSPGGDIDGYVR